MSKVPLYVSGSMLRGRSESDTRGSNVNIDFVFDALALAVKLFISTPCSVMYRGTSLTSKRPTPEGNHMTLGMVVLWVPRGALFLMSEVPLYPAVCMRMYTHAIPLCHFNLIVAILASCTASLLYRGTSLIRTTPPQDPTVGPCLRPYCGP